MADPINFDDLGAKKVGPQEPPAKIDFSDLGGKPVGQQSPDDAQPTSPTEQDDPGVVHGVIETTAKPFMDLGQSIYDTHIKPLTDLAETKRKNEEMQKEVKEHLVKGEYGKAAKRIYQVAEDDSVGLQLIHGILSSHVDQAKQTYEKAKAAYQAHKAGNYQEAERLLTEATGHGLATAVPIFGPAAAKAGEDIGAGKTGEGVGEGIGLIASILAPHVVGKGLSKIAGKIEHVIPGETKIAGEKIPKLKSQEAEATPAQRKSAQIESEPEIRAKQQKGSQKAVINVAQKATEESLNRINESRQPTTVQKEVPVPKPETGAPAPEPGKDVTRTKKEIGSQAAAVPERMMPDRPQGIGSQAAAVPDSIMNPKTVIEEERAPNVEPVDAKTSAAQVTNFGEAADKIEEGAKPVYQKLDQLSKGEFTALREQRKTALKVMREPSSVEAWEKASERKTEAEKGIQDIFDRHSDEIAPEDLKSANHAWRDAKILDTIHAAVDGASNGIPADVSGRTGIPQKLSGAKLQSNLGKMLRKMPQADIERVIGKDGLDNLYKISDLLDKPESAGNWRTVAENVAKYIGRKSVATAVGAAAGHVTGAGTTVGAAAGATVHEAMRAIMHRAATDPAVGRSMVNAVKAGATPKIYAPLIAAQIGKSLNPKKEEE